MFKKQVFIQEVAMDIRLRVSGRSLYPDVTLDELIVGGV